MNKIFIENFKEIILQQKKIIDVRAPIEFAQGHVPGAINLPILDNDERQHIGITYKQQGKEKAIEVGYRLVSGDNKAKKVKAWKEFLTANKDAVIYCFRGGLRSQITQKWLGEEGHDIPLVDGGYKAFRQYLNNQLNEIIEKIELVPISGMTGSFKTHLLHDLKQHHFPIVDLEALANHRGSAFGKKGIQPTQAQFENLVAWEFIQQQYQNKIFIEDESRLIGSCVVPEMVFNKLRNASVIWVEEEAETRAQNILHDYVATYLDCLDKIPETELQEKVERLFNNFEKSLLAIKTKLGGLRFQEILEDMKEAKKALLDDKEINLNLIWIRKLLSYYYDPMYQQSIIKRNPRILARGTRKEILQQVVSQSYFK